MKIGFIGLGIMGKPMCINLIKAGCELVVYSRKKAVAEELKGFGAEPVFSAKEAAEKAEIVLTMLPNSPQVKEVVLGENGVLKGAKKGTVLIDMSSIDPIESRRIGKELEKKGIDMLDAPVSGGEPKAIDGTLSIMAGGKKEVFDKCYKVLKAMAGTVVYVGELGAGNVTKLANQIIVASNIAALSEAYTLAKKLGVDPKLVFEAIKGGLAGSTVMNAKSPMMFERNFRPGFRINLHIKDLNNVLNAGHDAGAPLPLTALVMEMMQILKADGYEMEDHASLVKFYEKLADTCVGESEG